MSPPPLFDRDALALHRARAAREPVTFLLDHVAEDAALRLSAVLRRFETAVEVGALGTRLAGLVAPRVGSYLRLGPREAKPDVVADAEASPLAPGAADLVLSLLSLQWANDLPGALVQIRRALTADGLFLLAIPGGSTLTELRQAFTMAESEVEGGLSPRVAPFVDVRDLGALMQRAGFALPVTDSDTLTVRYDDVFRLIADLRGMGAANALTERRRTPTPRATIARMASIYQERFADPDGRIRATFEIVWGSGWAPHESQQKPLQPGSARMRLADALGVEERPAGDKAG